MSSATMPRSCAFSASSHPPRLPLSFFPSWIPPAVCSVCHSRRACDARYHITPRPHVNHVNRRLVIRARTRRAFDRMQAAMAKKRKHSRAEIATKLAQANELATRGKLQSDIARTLGVSVMTLHRWRKAPPGAHPAHETGEPGQTRGGCDRIAELQLENSRLRRLVTDLLLEKIKLEETAQKPFSA